MARRRYESNFTWLSCWLKWKYVEQIMYLERSSFLDVLPFWILALIGIFMHQRLFPRNFLMAGSSGISKFFWRDPYVLGLFIPQGCRLMTTYCTLPSFQLAYQDRRCGCLLGCMKWKRSRLKYTGGRESCREAALWTFWQIDVGIVYIFVQSANWRKMCMISLGRTSPQC